MIPWNPLLFANTGGMDQFLINMDSQIRFYLWTISEINAMRYAAELQKKAIAARNQKRVSHYKKRWRDRYISPDSRRPFIDEDPLKMMDKLVNNKQTYEHAMTFRQILWNIVDDQIPDLY